jgi:hypothetical protein
MENETLEENDSLEEQNEQQEEEKEDKQTVPLSKYMSEKKERQRLEREMADVKAAQEREETKNKYVQDGVDPEVAKLFAAQDEKMAKIEDMDRNSQIDKLATGDFFSDAPTYKDEIKERMRRYNISAEEAYMMVRGPLRAKELANQQAQLALYSKEEAEEKGLETGPAGTKKVKTYPLWEKEDDRALRGLQEAQPNAGWTKEKYYKRHYGE